jgi:hypothetical protein
MYKYACILLIACLLQSCSKDSEVNDDNTISLEFSPATIALNEIDASFAKDISYGPDERNTFDIFMPTSNEPTALVIYIHGGGFLGGEKENAYEPLWNDSWDVPSEIRTLLSQNIAFASINYRLVAFEGDQEGVLKSLNDSKRCLQYIRTISNVLNIDSNNIVLCGSSAGAGTSQWLAFSDDMADPDNEDLVLRASTRVKAIAVKATQASYDLLRYETDIFSEYDFNWLSYFQIDPSMKARFMSFYGINELYEFNSDDITSYRKKIDMLVMLSEDDPEFWVSNPQSPAVLPTQSNILNHHGFHARTLKQYGDNVGVPNVVYYADYDDPSGEGFVEFMVRKIQED